MRDDDTLAALAVGALLGGAFVLLARRPQPRPAPARRVMPEDYAEVQDDEYVLRLMTDHGPVEVVSKFPFVGPEWDADDDC